MSIFNNSNKPSSAEKLSTLQYESDLFEKLTDLQNEINVGYDTKVIAITNIENDVLAASFAKALADTYAFNNSSCLIIDANLYNPSFEKALELAKVVGDVRKIGSLTNDALSKEGYHLAYLSNKTNYLSIDKQTYPGIIFKDKFIQKFIEEHGRNYDHFIIIAPCIKKHKDLFLLADVVKSIVLVAQRDITKKKDIFEAISFCRNNNLPLAKTVVVE